MAGDNRLGSYFMANRDGEKRLPSKIPQNSRRIYRIRKKSVENFPFISRSADHPSGPGAGVEPVFQNLNAVNKDVDDPF